MGRIYLIDMVLYWMNATTFFFWQWIHLHDKFTHTHFYVIRFNESNILYAEIMTLFYGICICWVAKFRKVVGYSSSICTIQLVLSEILHQSLYVNELTMIPNYMRRIEISLLRTYREYNHCINVLAKLGALAMESLLILHESLVNLNICL